MKKKDKIKLIDISTIRFAPEFEFELPKKIDCEKLISKGRTLKGWEIKSDFSLDNGIELSPKNSNKLYYNEDSMTQIKEILALVKVHHAKAKTTCGLHIHIDAKWLNDKQVLNIVKEWIHRQEYIARRFEVSKERLDETCQLLPKSELHKLTLKNMHDYRNKKDFSFDSYKYLDEKYYSLNVTHLPKDDYQTLEFRLFSATTNFKEIQKSILFVLNFIRDSLERN